MFRKVIIFISILFGIFILFLSTAFILLQVNKEKLVGYILIYANQHFPGKIAIGEAHVKILDPFPDFSLVFKNITIHESKADTLSEPVLNAEKISVSLSILPLFSGQIQAGTIHITNANIKISEHDIKKPITNEKKQPFKIPDIQSFNLKLHNVGFRFENKLQRKWHAFSCQEVAIVKEEDNIMVSGPFLLYGLTFDTKIGTYLKDATVVLDLKTTLQKAQNNLQILPSIAYVNDHLYNLNGDLSWGTFAGLSLQIASKKAVLKEVLKCLTPKLVHTLNSLISPGAPVDDALFNVKAPFLPGEPYLDLYFNTKNMPIRFNFLPFLFSTSNVNGSFTNHANESLPNGDANSIFYLKNLSGDLDKIYLKGNIIIENLLKPVVKLDLAANVNLADKFSKENPLHFWQGSGIVKGKVDAFFSMNDFLSVNFKKGEYLRTTINIKNVYGQFKDQPLKFGPINGILVSNNNALKIDSISANIDKDQLKIKGSASGFLSYLMNQNKLLEVNANLETKHLDISKLIPQKKINTSTKRNKPQKLENIFEIADRWKLNLKLNAKELTFHRVKATKLNAEIKWEKGILEMPYWKMDMDHGSMILKGKIEGLHNIRPRFYAKIDMDNMDVKEVFYDFDNFFQKAITYHHLTGVLDTDLDFECSLGDHFMPELSTMKGYCNFSLKNGSIRDHESLIKVGKFIFSKRDFDDIKFKELHNRFELSGEEITIPKMEVETNVYSFYVEGKMNLNGNTDLRLMIPWEEFSRKRQQEVPLPETNQKGIFIRATVESGKLKLRYDFEKQREAKQSRKLRRKEQKI